MKVTGLDTLMALRKANDLAAVKVGAQHRIGSRCGDRHNRHLIDGCHLLQPVLYILGASSEHHCQISAVLAKQRQNRGATWHKTHGQGILRDHAGEIGQAAVEQAVHNTLRSGGRVGQQRDSIEHHCALQQMASHVQAFEEDSWLPLRKDTLPGYDV